MNVRLGLSSLLLVAALQPGDRSAGEQMPEAIRARLEQPPMPFDEPGAAAAFYAMRRVPLDNEKIDLAERYRRALVHRDGMPRFSSRLDRHLSEMDKEARPEPGRSQRLLDQWQPLGPGNIGGRTRTLLMDPKDKKVLYAAGVSGGVWKSSDGGGSWEPLGDFLPNIAVSAMAMHPEQPGVIYAGTGEGHFREVIRETSLPLRGAGIFVTRDGGRTWVRLPSTQSEDFYWVNDLVISPSDMNQIYAATRTGVWRSLDAGESWQQTLDPNVLGGCFDLVIRADREADYLLASCGTFAQATVYLNEQAESAQPWTAVLTEPGMGRTSLAIAPSQPDRVYALSASHVGGPQGRFDGGLHAVFRSDQGGVAGSWQATVRNTDATKLNTLLLTNPVIASLTTCGFGSSSYSTLGWYTNVIAVDAVDPDIVWAGGIDLFRSDDGGSNWGPVSFWWVSPPSAHADQHVILFDPDYDGEANQTMYLGGDGGVYRTDNARAAKAEGVRATCNPGNTGVQWVNLNNDYGVTQFYHGAPFPDGKSYLGGTQDNGTILGSDTANVNGWRNILGGDGGYVAVNPDNPDVLYAESQRLGFRKSINGGQTFFSALGGVEESPEDVLFIVPFTMDPRAADRLWIGGRRLWRTDNGAGSWTQAGSVLTSFGKVSAIAVSPDDPNQVLAGLSNGFVHRQQNALTSTADTDWPGVLPRAGYVSWLAFDPADAQTAYATYAGFGGAHVWKTTDAGVSWSPLDGEGNARLPDIPVHSLAVDPNDRQRIYLGTDLGVFVSTDGGRQWAVENTGFANAVTESLALIQPEGGAATLFAFTHGRGAWKVELQSEPAGCTPDRYLVHVVAETTGFVTTVLLTNLGTEDETVTLVPYDESGTDLGPIDVPVAAGRSEIVTSSDLFSQPAVSHVGLCASQQVAATVSYRFVLLGGGITAHAASTSVTATEFLYYPGEWGPVFDGFAIVNLGNSNAEVDAVLEDAAGNEIARVSVTDSLAPRGKLADLFDVLFDQQPGERIRLISTQPLAALFLRGTVPGPHPMLLLFQVQGIRVR